MRLLQNKKCFPAEEAVTYHRTKSKQKQKQTPPEHKKLTKAT